MKKRTLVSLLVSVFLLISTLPASSASEDWENVAPGIGYKEFNLPEPNRVYVARMDRAQENLTIDSGLANGELGAGPEIVSRMAQRYDETINFWGGETWGNRNYVVVAINGSYVNQEGFPQSGQIISGWYAKRFDDLGGGSGFAWKFDRTPFIGGCVTNPPQKQYIQNIATKDTLEIAGVNVPREQDGLFLYTSQWGSNTGTYDYGVEALVEVTRPTMVYPGPQNYIQGFVREIRDRQGSTYIPFDHIVLSARGEARERLLQLITIGDEIGINQEIRHYESDCKTRNPQSWTSTYASVSGDFVFLNNGEIRTYEDNAGATRYSPRTAIVYNDTYIYFVVVDGRQPDISIGMTIAGLAAFARDSLEANWGIALDGGGSSTMVVDGNVKNHPSDPCNRIFMPMIRQPNNSNGIVKQVSRPLSAPSVSPTCERPVVNSMMMMVVEPKVQSIYFTPGEQVQTLKAAELRLGPGTNYETLASLPADALGTIQPHRNGLDGVLAKGSYWWKVSFGGVVGWVQQEALIRPYSDFYEKFFTR